MADKYSDKKPLLAANFEGGAADAVPDPAKDLMDIGDKAEDEANKVYNHSIAYPLALTGAIFFGVGNFILALVGYEEGIKTFYPQSIGAAILFLGYHGTMWITALF